VTRYDRRTRALAGIVTYVRDDMVLVEGLDIADRGDLGDSIFCRKHGPKQGFGIITEASRYAVARPIA
jgi:hypothetical protein